MTARQVVETFVTVGDTRVFERHWRTDRPRFVLVIAHGAGEHSAYWADVAHALAPVGATSVAADFPGHGRSGGAMAPLSVGTCLEVLRGVVDRARARYPDLPVVLLGHSMGGLVATRLAQTRGDTIDVLVLHAPALVALAQADPSALLPPQTEPDPVLQRRIAEDRYRFRGEPTPDALAGALAELARGADAVRAAGPLPANLPVVWMHGRDDQSVPFAGAAHAFADVASDRAVFLGYPDRGHGGLLESNPEQMVRDLGAALRFALGW